MSQPRKTMKSEQIMPGLSSIIPGEIVEDILLRLPIKSLLRFKCVSKPWYSLLSSKMFVKTHLEKSANNISLAYPGFIKDFNQPNQAYCRLNLCSLGSLFHVTDGTESVVHDLDGPLTFYSDARTNIVGYANGLFCIREDAKEFILWNPATKKSRKLPPVYEEEFLWIDNYGGFGFDEANNDYKVMAVVRTDCPGGGCCSFKFIFRLYSLRTNSWKTLEDFLAIGAFQGSGVLVNGKFHWAARVRRDSGIRLEIVSFDLGSEAVGSVEQPSSVEGYHLCPALSVLDGCLAVLCGNKEDGTDIWVMKEYGVIGSWCKLMSVATIPGLQTYGYPYQVFTPLCISPEGEILLFKGSYALIYNPKENSFRRPQIKLTPYNQVGFYCESLVSLSPIPYDE